MTMTGHNQTAVIEFLSDPTSHGLAEVERIDTHISHLFLTGDRVFKLKRAVRLPYLDFSTPARRLAACEAELRLNRRTAPELYLGLRRITEAEEGPEFDGDGALLDAVVEMRRFDQDALFDRMARRGALTSRHLDELATEIAQFHAGAEIDTQADGAGIMAHVLKINAAGFRQDGFFSEAEISRLCAAFESALDGHAARLNARARDGHVRRCHGDLHLRNICLYEGRVRLFDCIEFNESLATIDVLYDLAFLAMDLWHRGLRSAASRVVNRYCDMALSEEDGFGLMPFFMALRAAVRALVSATQARTVARDRDELTHEARAYFDLAERLLAPGQARLVAVGGLSGSGKSTLAAALAPRLGRAPGARVISSDRTRKAMFGTPPDQPLPPEAYGAEVSARIYARIAERAERLLRDGVTVIADAVHERAEDRARIETAARAAQAPFDGVWLCAPADQLRARLLTRDPGASDADADVLARQLDRAPAMTGWDRIATTGSLADSLAAVLKRLGVPGHGRRAP